MPLFSIATVADLPEATARHKVAIETDKIVSTSVTLLESEESQERVVSIAQ
jgi:hypothetical protein